jgi:hypothetical protein
VVRAAVIDDCLTVDGMPMAAHALDTRLSVNVQVNGSGPFQFLVDSGADNSVTGRSMPATGVTLTRIEIGMLRINNLRVAFADVAPFAVFGLADRPALLLGCAARAQAYVAGLPPISGALPAPKLSVRTARARNFFMAETAVHPREMMVAGFSTHESI